MRRRRRQWRYVPDFFKHSLEVSSTDSCQCTAVDGYSEEDYEQLVRDARKVAKLTVGPKRPHDEDSSEVIHLILEIRMKTDPLFSIER